MKMNFDEAYSRILRNLPVNDYEKRTFRLNKFIEHGHL